MSSKRKHTSDGYPKRKRKVMTLAEKIEILDKLQSGVSAAAMARKYGVNESTIRSIKKVEDKIRGSVYSATAASMKVSYVSRRNPLLEKMEKILSNWIQEQTRKDIELSGPMIRNEALSIYESLGDKDDSGTGFTFQASKGWFENFKKRLSIGLYNSKFQEDVALTEQDEDENCGVGLNFQESKDWFTNFKKRFRLYNSKLQEQGASADRDNTIAEKFAAELVVHIKAKGYRSDQVFNADVTSLFWKKMLDRTDVPKEDCNENEHSELDNQLTLLLCCNASGDYKCKPMVLHHSENDCILKEKDKKCLPVIWKCHKPKCFTAKLFEDWFENHFLKEVHKYLMNKNLDFKVLLLLGNAPEHSPFLLEHHSSIEVMLLPPHITFILQPLDQGIIALFKCRYFRKSVGHILQMIESNPSLSVGECWDTFTMLQAIENIKASWDEIRPTALNACWNALWSECVRDIKYLPSINIELSRIVKLAKNIPGDEFQDIQEEDVEAFLHSHQEELTKEELDKTAKVEEERKEMREELQEEESETPRLTSQMLTEIFRTVSELNDKIIALDPSMERSLSIKKKIEAAVSPYQQIYKCIKRKTSSQPDSP